MHTGLSDLVAHIQKKTKAIMAEKKDEEINNSESRSTSKIILPTKAHNVNQTTQNIRGLFYRVINAVISEAFESLKLRGFHIANFPLLSLRKSTIGIICNMGERLEIFYQRLLITKLSVSTNFLSRFVTLMSNVL